MPAPRDRMTADPDMAARFRLRFVQNPRTDTLWQARFPYRFDTAPAASP